MGDPRKWERAAFAALLRLYPPAFRAAYRRELVAFFVQERRQCVRGRLAARAARWLWFWTGTIADTTRAAVTLRLGDHRTGRGTMGGWVTDLRHTLRVLRREWVFTSVALGTIVLGVGSASAIFSVVDGVVLRPLPYPDADRMVVVGSFFEERPGAPGAVSVGDFRQLRARAVAVRDVVLIDQFRDVALSEGEPEAVLVAIVSAGYLDLFDGTPVLGRGFSAADHAAGATPVAVLDHGYWVRHFGGDPGVIGTTLTLERNPLTIVGVMSPTFRPPVSVRAAGAIAWRPLRGDEDDSWYGLGASVVAKIGDGHDPASVAAELARIGESISNEFHPDFPYAYRAQSLQDRTVGDFRETGRILMIGALLLLLIACANAANLSLTRRVEREREMSLRVAIGARRTRILRLVALENGVLAIGGAMLGLALAAALVHALKVVSPGGIPRLDEVGVDARIALFAAAAAITTALVAGFLPGLRRPDAAALVQGRRLTGPGSLVRLRRSMVVLQTSLSLLLLTSSGLLLRSFQSLATRDTGLALEELATVRVDVRRSLESEEQLTFLMALEERVAGLGSVEAAGWVSDLPFTNDGTLSRITLEHTDGRVEWTEDFLPTTSVSPSYFSAARIGTARGRPLGPGDRDRTSSVAVVNEAFVSQFWPNEPDPVGLRFWYGDGEEGEAVEVVGVVGDVAYRLAAEARPLVYVPLSQSPWGRASLVVRASGDPRSVLGDLRRAGKALAPNLPIEVTTLADLRRNELLRPRFYALLVGSFATLACLLSLAGLYGTVSYAVRRRTRELGIRMALGARATSVVGEVLRSAVADSLLGTLIGVLVSLFATRLIADYLFRVEPTDVIAFAGASLLLFMASAVAAALPARRATRIDPHISLSAEA